MPKPEKELAAERFAYRASQPFQPLDPRAGSTMEINVMLRVAHALEYVAVQLGEINAKLATIEASYPKPPQRRT